MDRKITSANDSDALSALIESMVGLHSQSNALKIKPLKRSDLDTRDVSQAEATNCVPSQGLKTTPLQRTKKSPAIILSKIHAENSAPIHGAAAYLKSLITSFKKSS